MPPPFKQDTRLLSLNTPLGKDVLLLAGFTGTEAISRLFSFQLEMYSQKGDLAAKDIVGKNVTWTVKHQDAKPFHSAIHLRRDEPNSACMVLAVSSTVKSMTNFCSGPTARRLSSRQRAIISSSTASSVS